MRNPSDVATSVAMSWNQAPRFLANASMDWALLESVPSCDN